MEDRRQINLMFIMNDWRICNEKVHKEINRFMFFAGSVRIPYSRSKC